MTAASDSVKEPVRAFSVILPHVFEAFKQGDDSSARPSAAAWLSIVLPSSNRTGGTVTAHSPGSGHGSTSRCAADGRMAPHTCCAAL